MGYGSQDGYDWMMDGYGLGYSRDWWMPPPLDIDYDTSLLTGDDFLTSADPDFGGFTLGFDDVGNAFEVLDKDIFNDFLTYEDYNTLTNLGLDADGFITDSFGADALQGLLINGEDIDPTLNPSISRQDILRMTPTSQAGHERKILAARDELVFQEQKRAQDNIRNQIDKAYGFASAETTIDPNTGQTVGVGSFYDRENASQLSLDIAAEDLRAVIQDFADSPNYDGRFHEVDTREFLTNDESFGYTPDMPEYGQQFKNPNYNKPIVSEDLINDFRYGVDEITEEDVKEAVERIDLTFGVNTGETRTASGYFVAVALDLLGMNKVGTSLYLTQNAYNYVVNGVERITNKILGTGFDFPNLNVHEIAAEILNQKFKNKDGEPILEGVADKAGILFAFHDPTVYYLLSEMGENLGKFDPTGENIFDHIGDALLEGNILDAVQEQSEAGKFEGVEANRRTGAVGLLDNVSSFIQGLGVAGQKIFGPVLSQVIIDNAIFKGYPVSELLNGISNSLGPKSAKDWVRYFENKGIDPNAVEEKDISWWRKTFDDYLQSDEYTASGKTGLNSLLDDSSEGGLQAKYLTALNDYIEGITNKSIDRMQPAEFISVLNDQVQSAINRGDINDLLADESKLLSNLSIANYAAEQSGEPPMSLSEYRQFLQDELKINQTGQVTFGDNNEYYFDLETVNNLKQAFPDISDADYQAGFDYLVSEGEQGQAFTEGVGYDITPDAVFYASDYVDEGDYIVMRDVPAVASYFEYRTNEQGDEFVYDPMSGVTYGFEQARLFDEPGTRDDLYTFPSLSAEDLRNSDRTLNKEILKELVLTGKLEYKELKDLVTLNPEFFGAGSTRSALHNIDLELGDFYLKKYAGLTDEQLKDFNKADYVLPGTDSFIGNWGSRTDQISILYNWNTPGNSFGAGNWKSPTLEYMLMLNGYTDENFDVLPSNEAYNEDYTEESIFELRPFEVTESENGVPLIVQDTIYGFTEEYDPNRLNANTGEYLFREYSYDELKYKPYTSEYVGGGMYLTVPGQSRSPLYTDAQSRARVLKSLLEQGKITEQEAEDLDWSYYLARNPPTPPAGYDPYTGQPYGNYTTIDDVKAQWRDDSIFSNQNGSLEDGQNWRDSEAYLALEEIDLDTPLDYEPPVASFYDLPDFVVTGFNDTTDLFNAYQDRLDFIDETNFDFGTKEFLKDSASRLYESRKAFIDLDETSQQLILDAQAEATSDFIDLGVFNVTANNPRALNVELNARMNVINAADLSEGQKQYEIDLANAIYNSKLSEINTLTAKNLAINTAETERDAAIQREGAASQTATSLQARIDKIEAYEIPEFNVTAYMDAENPSAYMQNFVDEVMKGTTEEFGNFLSTENADQILGNVAALAQSETDLGIAETARKTNYDNYQEYLGKYNTAYAELTTANETLEANKLKIADLEASKYVELENFEVTATDIEGGQSQLNDFNSEIDRMVSEGEITSEQGDLEKSLATNSFNVYKATQDIASLQTTSDETITGLRADLKTAQDEAAGFEAQAEEFEGKYNTTKADLEANQAYVLPDFNTTAIIRDVFGFTQDVENDRWIAPEGFDGNTERFAWLDNFEAELRADGILTDQQIATILPDVESALWARVNREMKNAQLVKTRQELSDAESRIGELETYTLPEFNITATNQVELDAYLDGYQGYVDDAEKAGNISAEQALNFDTIIASIRSNGSQIFTLEAENKTKQGEIDGLLIENTGLTNTIGEKEEDILDLTGTISVIGSGFDVTLYDDIDNLNTGLASYIQGINDSDLDEEMKASQIAFAESMADMRRENLFVPTYEAPDFNVVAEGDLTGLNQSYAEAMFTLDSFLDNEYITQEEYDANVADLNTAYNTRKDVIVPTYTLPEFTVSELDAEGGFTNLDSEKQSFIDELQGFLDSDYITREEYDSFEAQIESAYDTKKRDITPVYEAPDFTVYGQLEPGQSFDDIDTAYNTAFDELTLNAQLGYISASDYITQLNDLQTSYEDARKGIAPAYELPDFSVYGQIAEGDDTTEIDTAYQNELTRLEEYKDSGYISLSEYYGFLGELETEYTTRREGVLPTYTMPDFGVTPASSLAELAEMEQAARDRFEMFSKSEYFPEDFDILTEQGNLESLFDAERARLQGTYTLPEFKVEDTKGLLTQKDIENLFGKYETGLQEDVVSGMLGLTDFFSAMQDAETTFDVEYAKRKPIQPREGDYALIPDENNEGDADQPTTGDFLTDYEYPSEIIGGGIDTSGILTGNYMAKLDPAYQLAELLLGQDRAKQMYPTGKSKGLADEQFQEIVNQFMLGQAEDAFEMQSGLSGKMQDLATEQRRLQRKADLDLMAEFGDPYRQQLQELYPEQAAALEKQREIADIATERAKGDLSPREQAQVEQQGYLFGATRGRDVDPMTLYRALGEETSIREGRETQATNQLTALMNMERGMYGDLPGVIGTQSPFIEGVGDITTPFNIGGIMDLGSTDYANQQKLQEVNMAIAQLDRDYQTAVALNQPSQAKSTLVKLNEYKAMADALGSTISAGQEAFGTLGSILGGVTSGISSFFGGDPYASDRASFDKYYGASGKGSNNDLLDYIMSL